MKIGLLIAAAMLAGCHPKPAHDKPYENTGDGQYLAIVPLGKCSCSPTEYNNHFHGVPCNNGHVETACIDGQCKNDTRCPAGDDSMVPENLIREHVYTDPGKVPVGSKVCIQSGDVPASMERHIWIRKDAEIGAYYDDCQRMNYTAEKGPDGWTVHVDIPKDAIHTDELYKELGYTRVAHVIVDRR